nr:hypothetical protein [Tanacetum cinerariifolium]
MEMTIDQQVALDEALVPHASRLRIRKSNFQLRSDITSKDSTLQVVYDVLRLTPFYKAFLVTSDLSTKMPRRAMRYTTPDSQRLSSTSSWLRILQFQREISAILPVELTNEDIRNSAAYKEYYAITSGAVLPKKKASVWKTQSSFDTTMPYPTAASTRLLTLRKGKQPANHLKQKKSSDEDDDVDVNDQSDAVVGDDGDQEDEDEQDDDDQDSDNDGVEFVHPKLSTHDEEPKDEESFDPIIQTPSQVEESNDESNDDESIDYLFESTPRVDVPVMTTIVPLLVTAPTLPLLIMSQVQQAPAPTPTTAPSTSLHDLPNFSSLFGFDHRLKTLEANFFEFMQTNQFAKSVSSILEIVDRYIDHRTNEAVKLAVQLQSVRLQDEAQAENEDFINKLDENIQKIIKEQVKTSYVIVTDLSELELKKILIEKMESNKSIHRSDEQKNLYKALVDAYECNKIILDKYEDTIKLKRRRDDADKDKNPPLDQNDGPRSKSHQKNASESTPAEEPMQTTQDLEEPSHQEFETGVADDQPVVEASQHPEWFHKQKKPPTHDHTLTPELLVDPIYKLMKGSCKILVELEFFLDEIVKWHNYKHLDWIAVCRDDDKLYKFKEGDFKRLRIQDNEDMLLLLVQGKLTNLTVEERFAFNNKDKQNWLMRIDELHKFSDGTLNDVRTTLDDCLKGIQMKYLPQTILKRSDKERAATMIQAIDK